MNVPTLWRTITRTCYQALTKIPNQNCNVISPSRNMHYICSNKWFPISPIVTPITAPMKKSELLKVTTPTITMTCGMKVRGQPKLRCKECYFVTRRERLYVMCKAKPRHKQMAMKKKPKNTWNLSHATQGKEREW